MKLGKKQRSENWTQEEKEILHQLISESAHILENKSTKIQINLKKIKEWKNVTSKFNEITGKNRSYYQVKLAWKRMKLSAKANLTNLSVHRQRQSRTDHWKKSPSPCQDDVKIMEIASRDFIVDHNYYDSTEINNVETSQVKKEFAIPSSTSESDLLIAIETISKSPSPPMQEKPGQFTKNNKKNQKIFENRVHPNNMSESSMDSNINYKKRQLEMLQVEHEYNIRIAQLKIKKLKLEIALLEKNNIDVENDSD